MPDDASLSSFLDQHQTTLQGLAVTALIERKDNRAQRREKLHASRRRPLTPQITEAEKHFRHDGWAEHRKVVDHALRANGVSPGCLARFRDCGSRCSLESTQDGQEWRLVAHYCGNRHCEPCQRSRAKRIQQNLVHLVGLGDWRFVTLTLAADTHGVGSIIDRLLTCFAKLRRTDAWTTAVDGGAYFVETTRGKRGDHWHVHLHALVCGRWIDREALRDHWRRITGDSWIVHVRFVTDPEKAVWYCAKYACKGCDAALYSDPRHLAEWMRGISGRRLVGTFGCLRGRRLEQQPADSADYHHRCTLGEYLTALSQGEAWAIGLKKYAARTELVERDASAAIDAAWPEEDLPGTPAG